MCSGFSVVFLSNGGIQFTAPDAEGNNHHTPIVRVAPLPPAYNGEQPYVRISCSNWDSSSYQVEDSPSWFTPEVAKEAKARVLNLMKKVKAVFDSSKDTGTYDTLLSSWQAELDSNPSGDRAKSLKTLIKEFAKEKEYQTKGGYTRIMGYLETSPAE